ncbi:MAG: hypothetical protein L3J39_07555 [Verrucomicrobiales bacterium]|nr:hypothetical protein [Verrucomicrobiales bacterium]
MALKITVQQLTLLQNACSCIEDREQLGKLIGRADEQDLPEIFDQLFSQVDQSDFSLHDWLTALLGFDTWLSQRSISSRPLANMISYIHCCTLSLSDSLPPPDLSLLTLKLLDQYGFDAVGGYKE